jgi:hypothetical protein
MAVSSHVAFRNSFAVAWTDVEYRTTVCCVLLINGRGSRGQRVLARVHRWTFRQRPAQAAARTRGPGRPWLHPDASPGDRLACGGWLVGGRFGSRPLCLRLRVCVLRLRFGSRSTRGHIARVDFRRPQHAVLRNQILNLIVHVFFEDGRFGLAFFRQKLPFLVHAFEQR